MKTLDWLRFCVLKFRNFLYFEIRPVHRLHFFLNHVRNFCCKKSKTLSIISLAIEKVYVISLKSNEDRRNTMSKQLSQLGIYFEYEDGANLTNPCEIKECFTAGSIHNLSHGALSCAKSHLELWRKIAGRKPGLYIVFEDDVTFENDFIEKISILQLRYPADADIFYLGSRNNRLRDIMYFTDFGYARCYNPRMGAFAYCITPDTAKKILALIIPIDLLCGGIDTALGILTRQRKLIAYQFKVSPVVHSSIFPSNIYNPSVPAKLLHQSTISKWPWV